MPLLDGGKVQLLGEPRKLAYIVYASAALQ